MSEHRHHHPHQHGPSTPAEAQAAGSVYTCPMHPQIRRPRPGFCPICGMALEPVVASAEDGPNPELTDMTRRFAVALVLGLPVFALEMGGHLTAMAVLGAATNWVQLALSAPVVLWAGWPFFARAAASLRTMTPNMFTLIALGVGVAWFYSLVAMLAPGLFPASLRDSMGGVPVYFEAATVITALALLGQVLELRARSRTSGAIRALLDLTPDTARRIEADGSDVEVALDAVRPGDRLRVRPGEKIPVDGELVEGRASIDESLLTGESMPVSKEPGAKLVAGSLNRSGSFVMRAEKVGSETRLARIVQMVAEAQRSRAPIQRMADRVSAWFVPLVMLVAASAGLFWLVLGPEPRLSYALVASVSVVIVACPCALGLATPMSIMVGVGRGAQTGVLIRNAEALERLERIDTLVIDKTGTLTEGRPAVTAILALPGQEEETLLRLAAGLERGSEHPLADALLRAAQARNLVLAEPEGFESPVGRGVFGTVEGRRLLLGGAPMMRERGIDVAPLAARAEALRADGATLVFMALDGALAGAFAIADPVKPGAADAVRALGQDGVALVMMTGDNRTTALAVARKLGIASVLAEVLPEDKAAKVEVLRSEGRTVGMAGDGVNDAPALAAAEVGIAMDAGADVAIESAGVTLLSGDLGGLVRARRLSRATMRNIRQNLFFAFAYNVAGIPLAAGALYPFTGWLLSPAIAAAAMALSSVSVIGNALRLRTVRL